MGYVVGIWKLEVDIGVDLESDEFGDGFGAFEDFV